MAHAPGIYPSVTQILAPWSDFSSIRPEVLAAAAERGTLVHGVCLAEAAGVWAVPDDTVNGYLESFRLWFNNAVEKVVAVEFEVISHTMKYIGHPDLAVVLKGDRAITIIDLKTPLVFNPIWRAQLAGYKAAELEMNRYEIERTATLRLSPKGKPPILNESTATYNQDLNGFYHSLAAWHYFQGLKRKDF